MKASNGPPWIETFDTGGYIQAAAAGAEDALVPTMVLVVITSENTRDQVAVKLTTAAEVDDLIAQLQKFKAMVWPSN